MKKIDVPITEQELQELLNGKTFVWVFDGVEVTLHQEEESDE